MAIVIDALRGSAVARSEAPALRWSRSPPSPPCSSCTLPSASVLLGAALFGLIADRLRRSRGDATGETAAEPALDTSTPGADARLDANRGDRRRRRPAVVASGGRAVNALGPSHVLVTLGVFFGQVAVMTFGGAYAVLGYVAQEAVHHHAWLTPGEMIDGLGMAETTPGPLIMVVQFVGYMAAFRHPGGSIRSGPA